MSLHTNKENVYEPQEDTFLLLAILKKELKNKKELKVCEVGVGSGEIIFQLERIFSTNKYYGSDINKDAIEITKKKLSKAIIFEGSLLEPFEEKFNIIYFNTPYLPYEEGEDYESLSILDKAIYGGKQGYEVIEKFILEINDKLDNQGEVFMLFSSLSKRDYIEHLLGVLFFEFECVARKKLSFEELYVYKIKKTQILKELSSKGIKEIKYLDSGKHSKVLEGNYNGNKAIIKIGKEQHLSKESLFMKKLKGEEFLPEFYFDGNGFIVREKLEGQQIRYWLENATRNEIVIVLNKIFNFCFRLDELGINKFEMTNPYKHIFIDKNLNCKMIDYERCIFTEDPKNTTQFLQYIMRNIEFFKNRKLSFSRDKILSTGRKYKKNREKVRIDSLLK